MASKRAKAAKKEPGFEDAMSELEEIVAALEEEELPLETLVERFEKGTQLLNRCQNVLNSAKQRLKTVAAAAEQDSSPENTLTTGDAENTDDPDNDDDDIRLF